MAKENFHVVVDQRIKIFARRKARELDVELNSQEVLASVQEFIRIVSANSDHNMRTAIQRVKANQKMDAAESELERWSILIKNIHLWR